MENKVFYRKLVGDLVKSLPEMDTVFHVIIGPRQTGKTTVAEQIIQQLGWPYVMVSADSPMPFDGTWIQTQWHLALAKIQESSSPVILVLDEIQKVRGWSEILKQLWDSSKNIRSKIRVIILGSSAIMVQKGLTESLAGRFYLHKLMHWSFEECQTAFGWNLSQWIYFGGYPGSVPFIKTVSNKNELQNESSNSVELHWKRYVQDSLIETIISRDVLNLEPITKPTLMRHLFVLAASCPSHVLSYNKMLGQLQDAGNTTTLSHYIRLLESAFLITGLEQFSKGIIRKRGSSPKLIIWNNALVNALSQKSFLSAKEDSSWWGWLVENAVGAHLLNHLDSLEWTVFYWKKEGFEVDFILTRGDQVWALEVKSGRVRPTPGLSMFKKMYPKTKALVIGSGGIPLDDFFSRAPEYWFF